MYIITLESIMDKLDQLIFVYCIRALCFALFLYTSCTFTISWKSFATFATFLVSILYIRIGRPIQLEKKEKTKDVINKLYPKLLPEQQDNEVAEAILKLVTYDAEDTPSLRNFEVIKSQSNCLFARKARVWGNPPWNEKLPLVENIYRLIPTFLKFTILCSSKKLDGFLIELPGDEYGSNIKDFGDSLYTVLTTLSDHDPAGIHCMSKSYVGKRGWVFEFNKCTFFITTFAPFYPTTHARYAFGTDNCYILFQPELSFAFHDLPSDTPETNWETPVTVRDKIRIAFKEAGRPYFIPDTIYGPMAHEMLRPIKDTDAVYEWWQKR